MYIKKTGAFVSPSFFMLVLAIMLVTIILIYVTLFCFGTGFGDDRWVRFGDKEKVDKAVPPAKTESKPEPHGVRHAA